MGVFWREFSSVAGPAVFTYTENFMSPYFCNAARIGLALCSLTLALPVFAQAPEPSAAVEAQPGIRAKALIRDLGNDTFRARTAAEKALRELGEAALPELKAAASGDSDPEVQWRSRRLVRQIEGGGQGELLRRSPDREAPAVDPDAPAVPGAPLRRDVRRRSPALPEDLQHRFDELFLRLERDFGVDIPRAHFFRDDVFSDLEEQMEARKSQLQSIQGSGQSMSMQMGPDGVRVDVKTKNEKGEEESKVYEAPDLETFHKQYPGVMEGRGLGGGLGGHFRFTMPQGMQPLAPNLPRVRGLGPRNWGALTVPLSDLALPDVASAPPVGKRLGVVVRREIAPELLEHLGIDGGLLVEQVEAGSLASELEIRAGDIVTRIEEQAIASTQHVQEALGKIEAGDDVAVTVMRRGKEVVLRGKKPAAKAAEATPLQPRDASDASESGSSSGDRKGR